MLVDFIYLYEFRSKLFLHNYFLFSEIIVVIYKKNLKKLYKNQIKKLTLKKKKNFRRKTNTKYTLISFFVHISFQEIRKPKTFSLIYIYHSVTLCLHIPIGHFLTPSEKQSYIYVFILLELS